MTVLTNETTVERAARRRERGAFLRSRRERLSPAEVGLPATGRRRTTGLRREELAMLAGISATWYTYLEQGRDVRPSDQVLAALADTLKLNVTERAHLLALNGTTPVSEETGETLSPEAARIPALVEPNPAYITGRRFDVLAWNPAAEDLFPALLSASQPNLARWIFMEPTARDTLVEWPEVARSVLARLRGVAGRHPQDHRVPELVADLLAASAEARDWWPRYDLLTSRSGIKRVRHPRLGLRTLGHASFHLADDPDQTLVIYTDAP